MNFDNIKIKTNIFMAPMSGCTDLPFRLITRSLGAKFCFFEMLDANALIYNHPGTMRLIKTVKKDSPIAAQLLGSDPQLMVQAAEKLTELVDISFLDINSACPAKKVIKKQAGACLLENEEKLFSIVKNLKSCLNIPITIKIRIGYNKPDIRNIIKITQKCEKLGISAIFVHGRTKAQGYSGEINYQAIKQIKKNLNIPVFGSGNIFNAAEADKMFNLTLCDGILVARGALGNPWIFREIDAYIKTKKIILPPSIAEKKKILKKHIGYIVKYKDHTYPVRLGLIKKITIWYTKGIPDASKIRGKISGLKTYEDIMDIINSIPDK